MVDSCCPTHILPAGPRALGMSGNIGHRGGGRVDTFCTGPKRHISQDSLGLGFLLGPGQDLENHRGKSRSSGGRLWSLRPILIKVQGGPVPFLPDGDRRRWHVDPSKPGVGRAWLRALFTLLWEGRRDVLEMARAEGADPLPGHVNLGKLLNFSKSPYHAL